MPSEPRIPTEPTLEELSAYLDHELADDVKARVAEHVAGCVDCQARLDGLRQTAHAIRALPMETPPRRFTIPARRRESSHWAPVVGWIGGIAAAMLVIVVGVQHLPFQGPATTASGGSATHYFAAPAARPAPGLGQGSNDALTTSKSVLGNAATVSDPRNPSRTLTLSTDASVYSPTGVMTIQVRIAGFAPEQVSQPRLLLERNGYAVELATPTHGTTSVPPIFQVSYDLARLPLASPAAGSYTLILIESLPAPASGSGSTLVARLPITIQG
jgi:anti-sigma factor RsiW